MRATLFKAPAARASVRAAASNRPMWYPGATAPPSLDGSMIGDYGFDPLRLSVNKGMLPYYREAELTNGRWAMAAVAGILFTDAVGLGDWWTAGAKQYAIDNQTLAIIELVVMAAFEFKRWDNFKKTGTGGLLNWAPFDPAGMGKSDEMKLKEVKNARLAMVAFLGFSSQAAVQGLGPIECLQKHLENPQANNIFTSSVGLEATVAVVALSIAPMLIEARKTLGGNKEDKFRPIPW